MKREIAHVFPKAHQVIKIALDFRPGTLRPRRSDDQTHTLWNFHITGNFLETPPITSIGNLAGNSTAPRRIWHENAVTSGQRKISCKGCTLVATLFLDDLHKNDLAAFDNFLNLVLTARRPARTPGNFFQCVLSTN